MTDFSSKKFYITTTLPYVNAEPHIGFALEFVRADAVARYKKNQGFDVFFNTGTDEHGAKIFKKAQGENRGAQDFVNELVEKFKDLIEILDISSDVVFTRTTEPHHIKSAQAFWKVCDERGFIYKKNYQVKYCVGCELEKTESELIDGHCPIHPNLEIELIDEENYFFKFSAFGEKLLALYTEHADFVIPNHRMHEIVSFVEHGLSDFSISRLAEKMPWGIAVPGDSQHVMYVWFDALVNYISAIGWPDDLETFRTWHIETGGMVQYCGKDNLRQQAAMWQAMLMAADLPSSKHIIVNGFIMGEGGVKMSKSLGNVINPVDLVKEYGTDALRYYLLREVSSFEDSPFTESMFKATYNANLANGLGNLVSRVMTMAENNLVHPIVLEHVTLSDEYKQAFDTYEIQKAANMTWQKIGELDKKIQETQPFKLIKTDIEKGNEIIRQLVLGLHEISVYLEPLLPKTARAMKELIQKNKKPQTPLFVRKD